MIQRQLQFFFSFLISCWLTAPFNNHKHFSCILIYKFNCIICISWTKLIQANLSSILCGRIWIFMRNMEGKLSVYSFENQIVITHMTFFEFSTRLSSHHLQLKRLHRYEYIIVEKEWFNENISVIFFCMWSFKLNRNKMILHWVLKKWLVESEVDVFWPSLFTSTIDTSKAWWMWRSIIN